MKCGSKPVADAGEDRLREECGVFGVFGHDDAAALTALGLHALQHRGQEAAGIVAYDGERFHSERGLGLVSDHFSNEATIGRLKGRMAVGHVRYSTTGETILRNVQPLFAELATGGLAIGHNGNLTNGLTLRRDLIAAGAMYHSTSDSEAVLHLVARSPKRRIVERFIDALRSLEGAYSLVALTNKKLMGARDPLGIRPLVLGEFNGAHVLASETCALDIIGARFVREIDNGEVVVITEAGIESLRPFPKLAPRPCIFEYIYFSRPDSVLGGKSIYDVRKQMGGSSPGRRRRTWTWSFRFPIPAFRQPWGTHSSRTSRLSSASSAITTSDGLHRADATNPRARRPAQAQRQPLGNPRQTRPAGG